MQHRHHRLGSTRISTVLPLDCVPILLAGAGFHGIWFKLVNTLVRHWIGYIRNRDMLQPIEKRASKGHGRVGGKCSALQPMLNLTPHFPCCGSFQ